MINKKKISKKILAFVLAITTMIAFTPMIAFTQNAEAADGDLVKVYDTEGRFVDSYQYLSTAYVILLSKGGGTIDFLRDWDWEDLNGTALNGEINIPDKETVTINLNGHVIDRNLDGKSIDSKGGLFQVGENATLIVNGGADANDSSSTTVHKGELEQGVWSQDSTGTVDYSGGMLVGGNNSDGGGCITEGKNAKVILNNVTLAGNVSTYGGGAVYLGGSNSSSSELVLNNSRLEYDKAENCHGGAICSDYGYVTINKGSSISHNSVTGDFDGGGIYYDANLDIDENSGKYPLMINGGKKDDSSSKSVDIIGNTAEYGGGIYLNYGEKSEIINANIKNNTSSKSGGGIYVNEDQLGISDCNISENTAGYRGGGIYLNKTYCSIKGTSINRNLCTNDGGGIYINGANNTIKDSSVEYNVAGDGGGICFDYEPLWNERELCISGKIIVKNNETNAKVKSNLLIDAGSETSSSYCILDTNDLSDYSEIGISMPAGYEETARLLTTNADANPSCFFSDKGSSMYIDIHTFSIEYEPDIESITIRKRTEADPYSMTLNTLYYVNKDHFKTGASVYISTDIPEGKVFAGWDVSDASGLTIPSTSVGTFTMPARDITLTATFVDEIKEVRLDGVKMPEGNTILPEKVTAVDRSSGKDLSGVNATPSIVWTDKDGNKVSGHADFNTAYTATVTLTKDEAHAVGFSKDVKAYVNGIGNASSCTYNPVDGSVVITYNFPATAKAKLTAQPVGPQDLSIKAGKTIDEVKAMLPAAIAVKTEDFTKMANVTWTCSGFDGNTAGTVNTFTGTLDLDSIDIDKSTYTDTVATKVKVQQNEIAAAPTVTSGNPAASTEAQTIKLATATSGAAIKYSLQTNGGAATEYADYQDTGIVLAAPTEGNTNTYKITAYTVGSAGTDDSAKVTFTYVISTPVPKYSISFTGSDTGYYGQGDTPWSATSASTYTKGSDVTITAPQSGDFADEVFDHWEVVSGTTGITDETRTNRTITIPNLSGDVELKAIYNPVVKKIDLTLDQPTAGKDFDITVDTCKATVTKEHDVKDLVSPVTWSPSDTKADYGTVYTAAVKLNKAMLAQVSPDTKFFFADNLTIKVNGSEVAGSVVGNDNDAVICIPFPKTGARPTYNVTIADPADSHITLTKATANGSATQTGVSGSMDPVVYTADEGYYFPGTYAVTSSNGISVRRNSYDQITVSGTPSANAEITLKAATKKEDQQAPPVTDGVGKIAKTTTAMEYASSKSSTEWKPCSEGTTAVPAGTWYVRFAATETKNAGEAATVVVSAAEKYSVTWNVTSGTGKGTAVNATEGQNYTGTITADSGAKLPSKITVTVEGKEITDFIYDSATGKVAIPAKNVTGDIVITVLCTYYVPSSGITGGKVTYDTPPVNGKDFTGKIRSDAGYSLPKTIKITVGGKALTTDQYTYDPATGIFTMPGKYVTGTINVTAKGFKSNVKGVQVTKAPLIYKVTKSSSKKTSTSLESASASTNAYGTVTVVKPVKKSYKNVSIPKTVTINQYAYKVTSISAKACYKSNRITFITIGKNVKTIGEAAFGKCTKLKTVKFTGTKVTKISKGAFKTCAKKCTFKIPKAKYSKYVKMLKKSGVPKGAKYKAI